MSLKALLSGIFLISVLSFSLIFSNNTEKVDSLRILLYPINGDDLKDPEFGMFGKSTIGLGDDKSLLIEVQGKHIGVSSSARNRIPGENGDHEVAVLYSVFNPSDDNDLYKFEARVFVIKKGGTDVVE